LKQPPGETCDGQLVTPRNLSVERLVGVFSLFGLLIYGFTRLGQEYFCAGFGVAPEDLGLSYAFSVSRASSLLLVLVPWLAVVGAVISIIRPGPRSMLKGPRWVLVCVSASYLGWEWTRVVVERYGISGAVWATIALIAGYFFSHAALTGRRGVAFFSLMTCAAAGVFFSVTVGVQAASEVRRFGEGGEVLFGITAYRARLVGPASQLLPQQIEQVTVLGRSGGRLVLFDAKTQAVMLIPEQEAAIIRSSLPRPGAPR
jgi:hypothetical protein